MMTTPGLASADYAIIAVGDSRNGASSFYQVITKRNNPPNPPPPRSGAGDVCQLDVAPDDKENGTGMAAQTVVFEAALTWIMRDIAVVPIRWRSKQPLVHWTPYQSSLPTAAELQSWFRYNINLGVVCGWHGLTVVDFDDRDVYDLWRAAYPGVETYQVSTGRGVHAYFYTARQVRIKKLWKIDIKTNGYVLAPPSIHPSGRAYTVLSRGGDGGVARIDSVLDVLPAVELPPAAAPSMPPAARPADPWRAATTPQADLIATIRGAYDILDFFPDAYQTGQGWYMACCPLHDDYNPSMWINTERQVCGCHAGCNNGRPLDVINLYAQTQGMSNAQAVEELRRQL